MINCYAASANEFSLILPKQLITVIPIATRAIQIVILKVILMIWGQVYILPDRWYLLLYRFIVALQRSGSNNRRSHYRSEERPVQEHHSGSRRWYFMRFSLISDLTPASGIPDFRSANGLYRNLNKFPVPYLSDPSSIFSIKDFHRLSTPFWILAREMFYSNHKYHPTPCHFMLSLLKDRGVLRRIYTQNIDGLERDAGLAPPLLIEGHGTSRECSCIRCGKEFRPDLSQRCVDTRTVPICPFCGGPIKVEAISGIEE